MTNPDQKTILLEQAFEELKVICNNFQDEYLSIKDITNKVAYSEKQVIRVVRNLFKQGKLTRIKKQITSGRPTYFYGHST